MSNVVTMIRPTMQHALARTVAQSLPGQGPVAEVIILDHLRDFHAPAQIDDLEKRIAATCG